MSQPTKLLIVCWGFSIHALKRIRIFSEDPRFSVIVASDYDYNLSNTKKVLLTSAIINKYANVKSEVTKKIVGFLGRIIVGLIAIPDYLILLNTIRRDKPQVMLLQTLLYPCYLSIWLPKTIPRVVTFWNGDVIWWAKRDGIEKLWKKQLITTGSRQATAITVNSQFAKKCTLDYGVDEDRIHVIGYPGVDLSHFSSRDRNEAKNQLNIKAEHMVLWPRGLGGYLNSDIFLLAAKRVLEQYPNTMFVFLSDAGKRYLPQHQKMVREMGIADHFVWRQQIPYGDMPIYYSAADVVVSLSSNDSRPNVMLEAMACGTPVIVSDLPQIKEWVTDNYNGYLVPPRDSIKAAQAIGKILDPNNHVLNQSFIKINLDLVKQRADLFRSISEIRDLIISVAQNH